MDRFRSCYRLRAAGSGARQVGRRPAGSRRSLRQGRKAVPVRPVPRCVQRGKGRKAGADRGRLAQWHEQLFSQVLARRQVDRLLPGQELHAASTRQRTVHHSGHGRPSPSAAVQHLPHELLAQLVPEQQVAGVLLQTVLSLHATFSDAHRRGRPQQRPRRPFPFHRTAKGGEHSRVRQCQAGRDPEDPGGVPGRPALLPGRLRLHRARRPGRCHPAVRKIAGDQSAEHALTPRPGGCALGVGQDRRIQESARQDPRNRAGPRTGSLPPGRHPAR